MLDTIRIMAMVAVVFPRHRAKAKPIRTLTTTTKTGATASRSYARRGWRGLASVA
jgi:hypothetical protein